MRHRKAGRKLGRDSSHRKAMLRNMVTSLFKYEQLETTDAKAKRLRPVAEKMITLAKRGDLHARRQTLAYIRDKTITHRLFEELKDRYLEMQGGYVRIIKKGNRKGDGAPISIVQLLSFDGDRKKGKRKGKAGAKAASKASSKASSKAVRSAGAAKPKKEKGSEVKEGEKD